MNHFLSKLSGGWGIVLGRDYPNQKYLPQDKSQTEKAAITQEWYQEAGHTGMLSTVGGVLGKVIDCVVVSGYGNGILRDSQIDAGSNGRR